MFAMIAAYLSPSEGFHLRRAAGNLTFRHEDSEGRTYKNGVLHSYEDKPAVNTLLYQMWYKNGELHREGDLPAIIDGEHYKIWYKNGYVYRNQV
jgi:antitoxin component YwqK of YwqJK toxin-antitoxin module